MGFIGSMFSDDKGAGYQAGGADIQSAVSTQQAQLAAAEQESFVQALSAQRGIQNQSSVFNQLQGVANGTGPNPAQAMLAQSTGNNVANQAALMAGQRGASQNVGLIARQAGQQGGAMQQQAAGQAASMQAQQSLGALNQLGGIAGQQVAQQQAGIQQQNQNLQNAISQQNNARVGMQSNINNANASIAGINAQNQGAMVGGLLGGAGSALSLAHGGQVPGYADGGTVDDNEDGPKSSFAKAFNGFNTMGSTPGKPNPLQSGVATLVGGGIKAAMAPTPMPIGAPQMLPAMQMQAPAPLMAAHGAVVGEQLASQGMQVPGQARVAGDSAKNDTVDAKLSPGEAVIPRSIMLGPNAPEKAAEFVRQILAKKHRR